MCVRNISSQEEHNAATTGFDNFKSLSCFSDISSRLLFFLVHIQFLQTELHSTFFSSSISFSFFYFLLCLLFLLYWISSVRLYTVDTLPVPIAMLFSYL